MPEPRPLSCGDGQLAIDVHAHYISPEYREAARLVGIERLDGRTLAVPQWAPEDALTFMDAAGIGAAALSLTTPGVGFVPPSPARADLVQRVNDYGASVVADYPARFALLIALALPDVDAAVAEVVRAATELRADGVCLLTNYDGVYLGDQRLEPLMDELNRRHMVVLIHPTSPACWDVVSFGRPRGMIEFMFDTTRAVLNMVLSGVTRRYPDIRFIVPHSGAVLPLLADRVGILNPLIGTADSVTIDVVGELGKFYYDLAGMPLPRALAPLLTIARESHVVYGSDFPATGATLVTELAAQLRDGLTPAQRDAFFRTNAESLFPRLTSSAEDG